MDSEKAKIIDLLRKNLVFKGQELDEISDNFDLYREELKKLCKEIDAHNRTTEELSKLSSKSARLNYENYETYMAVHTNAIKISGSRAALKIAGQRLTSELEKEIDDLLDKYLMMKF